MAKVLLQGEEGVELSKKIIVQKTECLQLWRMVPLLNKVSVSWWRSMCDRFASQ